MSKSPWATDGKAARKAKREMASELQQEVDDLLTRWLRNQRTMGIDPHSAYNAITSALFSAMVNTTVNMVQDGQRRMALEDMRDLINEATDVAIAVVSPDEKKAKKAKKR